MFIISKTNYFQLHGFCSKKISVFLNCRRTYRNYQTVLNIEKRQYLLDHWSERSDKGFKGTVVSQAWKVTLKGNVHISTLPFPPPFPHFPLPKGQRSLLTLLLEISLWFFACRPELRYSFLIKTQSGEKLIFPLSKVINIG